jgi:diacylglycerol O-acyltransferase / wax synthase
VGFPASVGRVFRPAATPPSPLLRDRSLSYHFDVLELGVDDLRRAGKAAGGTVTDAFLAALAGGLRLYHQRLGSPVERLPFAMPISIRREGDPLASNRVSAVFLAPPVGVTDVRTRMEQIHDEVRRACSEPALAAINQLLPAVRLLPPIVFQAAMRAATFDVGASALLGPDRDLYTAGAKVVRLYGFGQLIGGAMTVGLLSMADMCCVTINSDAAALTEPDLFVACLREGFEEVLELGGQHHRVTTPATESMPGS